MPTPAIKICGISTPEALEATIRARADYAGFVFFARSPRNVSPTQAADLGARAQGRIRRVGLFVDADDSTIAEAVDAAGLDVLQLHGRETPERAAQLRSRFGIPVWKAMAIASIGDVARAHAYAGAADLMLFDAKTPTGALPGGMGLSFDWSLVAHWNGPLKWGLAGGLTAGNVGHAIALTGAPLVDTSSGVESAPGMKDLDRIAAFCTAVRAA
ncbi:phosphoribosylanthranilate isomerase [Novosphingobium album (ex Hu et al. 2023)]|uniref:N-(5'-phosphoribosyl)anthranilate isomerase n=1 Tax=Novosphingobium album (ex Hu et al. 2023) TaxID=2930093 RepID=A0ABT0AWD0_9SPHN|nr:phosphoribosylanthranilate isomerase [Novosphingobium album (ex Hu et al. 2023)]MCJ2177057.1 phosphoribosylanthranilate isomerase [Novosphingobium album (ex Hu et al. 2023)]